MTAPVLRDVGAVEIVRADLLSPAIYQTAAYLGARYPDTTSLEATVALMRSFPAWVAKEAAADAGSRIKGRQRRAS